DEEAEGRMLLAARRLSYTALEHTGRSLLIDDVGVPLSKLAEMLGRIPEIADACEVEIATVGHAGDGNLHPTILYDAGDEASAGRAVAALRAILDCALSLGGTATGEHGVGTLKREFVRAELGNATELHRLIKESFDPRGLMNPGKGL